MNDDLFTYELRRMIAERDFDAMLDLYQQTNRELGTTWRQLESLRDFVANEFPALLEAYDEEAAD